MYQKRLVAAKPKPGQLCQPRRTLMDIETRRTNSKGQIHDEVPSEHLCITNRLGSAWTRQRELQWLRASTTSKTKEGTSDRGLGRGYTYARDGLDGHFDPRKLGLERGEMFIKV